MDDLTKQATALHEHPGLSTFWQQVDHQAVSGQTTRAGVFQAMANEADHPLKERLATTMNADPMLANAIHQAYNTFDRLSTAWENCAAAYRKRVRPGHRPQTRSSGCKLLAGTHHRSKITPCWLKWRSDW
ncbi:MAG: hypothetical protein HC808_19275 [Candidatus Competibacteraceae bacterium]|nr:hypothetical protein [Candidatus Competibacteraceae bacterium]